MPKYGELGSPIRVCFIIAILFLLFAVIFGIHDSPREHTNREAHAAASAVQNK